jgi:hypothetical protein
MVLVVTHWWDGYECERAEVPNGFKEVLCNACLAPMGMFVPEDWPRIEAVCQRCNDEPGDESI